MMLRDPRAHLLAGLLASLASSACKDVNEHYSSLDRLPVDGQPTACPPTESAELSVLQPQCTEDFAVKAGPFEERLPNDRVRCTYLVAYSDVENCVPATVGRPLFAGRSRVAPLVSRSWGA